MIHLLLLTTLQILSLSFVFSGFKLTCFSEHFFLNICFGFIGFMYLSNYVFKQFWKNFPFSVLSFYKMPINLVVDISLSPLCLLLFSICSIYLSLSGAGSIFQFTFILRAKCSCPSFLKEAPLLDFTPEFCVLSHNSVRKLKVTRFIKYPPDRMKI